MDYCPSQQTVALICYRKGWMFEIKSTHLGILSLLLATLSISITNSGVWKTRTTFRWISTKNNFFWHRAGSSPFNGAGSTFGKLHLWRKTSTSHFQGLSAKLKVRRRNHLKMVVPTTSRHDETSLRKVKVLYLEVQNKIQSSLSLLNIGKKKSHRLQLLKIFDKYHQHRHSLITLVLCDK